MWGFGLRADGLRGEHGEERLVGEWLLDQRQSEALGSPTDQGAGIPGHQDDGRADVEGAEPAEHLDPVHQRHDVVDDDAVRFWAGEGGQHARSAAKGLYAMPLALKQEAERMQDRGIVIHDVDRRWEGCRHDVRRGAHVQGVF